jgi:pantoate--beta-alanine ligase
MGALHAGHRSLIQRARETCQTVVVSIFVNPLQFGPAEDYRHYPRALSHDLEICREEHVDVVFAPQLDELFPSQFQTTVTVGELSKRWEGAHRPNHFQGVTTIVTKLLNLVRPAHTFFGQKDYQQCVVIQQLVKDLELNTQVILCPTVRDADGLALSSRNQYLTASQRQQQAHLLYQALSAGKRAMTKGQYAAKEIGKIMHKVVKTDRDIAIDYLDCCHALTLEPLKHVEGKVVLLGAIRLGNVRLIDNLLVRVRN